MGMSRKDYELIASRIKTVRSSGLTNSANIALRVLAYGLADDFGNDNPRFNSGIFHAACAPDEETQIEDVEGKTYTRLNPIAVGHLSDDKEHFNCGRCLLILPSPMMDGEDRIDEPRWTTNDGFVCESCASTHREYKEEFEKHA